MNEQENSDPEIEDQCTVRFEEKACPCRGDIPSPLEEYREACANMRHFGNMRLGFLTLYFALSAGIFSVAFGNSLQIDVSARFFFVLVGVIASCTFALAEKRTVEYWKLFTDRAKELESELGFRQHSQVIRPMIFSASNAIMSLFAVAILGWLSFAFYLGQSWATS